MHADDIPRLLRELGADRPPTEREWQSFAQLAHRSLRIRRAMVAGLASAVALTGIFAGTDLLVGRDRPDPAPPVDEPLPVPPPTPSPEPSPLAPILVYEPGAGNGFSSGDVVQGTADVFEANVLIRVRGEDGGILFEDFTTATCGTGCRGDYSKTVQFDVEREQPGTIEVFEVSAEDGSEINKVKVPVTLEP